MPKSRKKPAVKKAAPKLYKLHTIEGGYSVRHKDRAADIRLFKGPGAMKRAVAFRDELERKAANAE